MVLAPGLSQAAYFSEGDFFNDIHGEIQNIDFSGYGIGEDVRFQNINGALFTAESTLMLDGSMRISPANQRDCFQLLFASDDVIGVSFNAHTSSSGNTNFFARAFSDSDELVDIVFDYTLPNTGDNFIGLASLQGIKYITVNEEDLKKITYGNFRVIHNANPVPIPGSLFLLLPGLCLLGVWKKLK